MGDAPSMGSTEDVSRLMRLSIIIVNYEGCRYLGPCLDAIAAVLREPCEVILVDNASTDGSAQFVRERYPYVRLIENRENLGFAAGNNIGAKVATGEYLLLLNNDTCLLDDLSPALAIMDGNPRLGALGIRMLGMDNAYRRSAGRFPALLRFLRLSQLYARGDGLVDGHFSEPTRWRAVDWVEGSFLLTRRSLWESLGGLDNGYFMYMEDVDYCRRLSGRGLATAYLPVLRYQHAGGYSAARVAWLSASLRRYANKFYRWPMRPLAHGAIMINLAAKLIRTAVASITADTASRPDRRADLVACWHALRAERARPGNGGSERTASVSQR
jgi:GT2 family glycosyltransferase